MLGQVSRDAGRAIAVQCHKSCAMHGTAAGGIVGPALFGALIDTGEPTQILWGYLLGGALMLIAAAVELKLGVPAERCALEDVARPLSAAD